MDDAAAGMIDRAARLADFGHARDDFEQAIGRVPEEALDYKPEGEDYSIRDLVPHVAESIMFYNHVLDRIREAEYQEVRLVVTGEHADKAKGAYLRQRGGNPLRNRAAAGSLDELEQLHDRMAARLREMVENEYNRAAPVYYPESEEPYPTAGSDILGWLTDHYREHVEQANKMHAEWEARR